MIVAAGSAQSYFGRDEFGAYAPGMKTIDDALEVRGRIFGAFELAELEADPVRRAAWLTFVVVGAGPTGVEMAGQIAELSRYSLPLELQADRHRRLRASSWSTPRRGSCRASTSASRSGRRRSSSGWASRSGRGAWSPGWTPQASSSRRVTASSGSLR